MEVPAWDTLEVVRVTHSQLEGWALAFFALVVGLDVAIHLSGESPGPVWRIEWREQTRLLAWKTRRWQLRLPAFHDVVVLKSLLKTLSLVSFAFAIILEIAAYPYSKRIDELADADLSYSRRQTVAALTKSGEANKQAGAANQKAESFRLDIAKAQRGAAEANRAAQKEHLARVKIEERIKDRTLNNEQQQHIEAKLRPFSGTPYELAATPLPECHSLTATIDLILRSSGWVNKDSARTDFRLNITLPSGSKVEQEYVSGVIVKLPQGVYDQRRSAAEALVLALRAEKINAKDSLLKGDDPSPNNIHIVIGSKE